MFSQNIYEAQTLTHSAGSFTKCMHWYSDGEEEWDLTKFSYSCTQSHNVAHTLKGDH